MDLENVSPGPNNSLRRELVQPIAIRLEDLEKILSFLAGEVTKMRQLNSQWHHDSAYAPSSLVTEGTVEVKSSRPETGRRIGK